MIFALAKTEPAVFLMLTEQDVNDMRSGRSKFVDSRHTGGITFNKVILSLHKNNEEALDLVKSAEFAPDGNRPIDDEKQCKGCLGLMKSYLLLDEMCIVCWKEKAKCQ